MAAPGYESAITLIRAEGDATHQETTKQVTHASLPQPVTLDDQVIDESATAALRATRTYTYANIDPAGPPIYSTGYADNVEEI